MKVCLGLPVPPVGCTGSVLTGDIAFVRLWADWGHCLWLHRLWADWGHCLWLHRLWADWGHCLCEALG
jgi:hypothetical protein